MYRYSRIISILLPLLIGGVFFFIPFNTYAAGQCSSLHNRHYVNFYFYDENGITWAAHPINPCLPGAQATTRTPVQVTRPNNIVSPNDNWVDANGNWRRWQCDDANVYPRVVVRTYRCNTLGPGFMYVDLQINLPYDRNFTEWDFLEDGVVQFSGVGSRVTIPTSAIQSDSGEKYRVNIQMVLATTDIQGYKVKMPNNVHTPPNAVSNQTITLYNPLTATNATRTENPYFFLDLDPQPTYAVSAAQPAVNYSVGYTMCYNAIDCHNDPITLANTVNVNSPAGGYTDLWWHYWEYVGWYRLKQVSMHKQTPIVNFIPPNVVPYDSFDTDEELLNIKLATEPDGIGLITSSGAIDIGPNTTNVSNIYKVSNKDWADTNYINSKGYLANLSSFTSYARARKDIKVITSLSEMESNRINILYTTNLYLENDSFNSVNNAVLIVEGNVLFNRSAAATQIFNPGRNSIAIISTGQMQVHQDITELNGIFIAGSFDLARNVANSTTPLKVVGNLISNTAITNLERNRPITEYQRPSLYIVFYPQFYANLAPHLSTIIQEGRQLQ